jgi:hypothetical protein
MKICDLSCFLPTPYSVQNTIAQLSEDLRRATEKQREAEKQKQIEIKKQKQMSDTLRSQNQALEVRIFFPCFQLLFPPLVEMM